jgi:hypothetical protein
MQVIEKFCLPVFICRTKEKPKNWRLHPLISERVEICKAVLASFDSYRMAIILHCM